MNQRYENLPERLGQAIAQRMLENGASERIKSSALATLANHRQARRKARSRRVLVGIGLVWIFGSFGFWLGGKMPLPNAIAQSEGNKVNTQASQPRILRINLTLSDPKDLKIKQGDILKEGAVISDRDDEKRRLEAQRADYLATIKRLSLESPKPIEPIAVRKPAQLPEQSFAEFESEVDFQRIKVKNAEQKVTLQQRKLDLIQTLDAKDLPAGVNEHEQEKLQQLKSDLAKEQALLQLQLGKFETAKSNRSLKEYETEQANIRAALEANKTQLEYSKALAEWEKSDQDRQFRISELKSKIATVDDKLKEISTVRAQYDSEVRRIRFVKQINNQIDVELLLAITSDRKRSNSQRPEAPKSNRGEVAKPFTSTGSATNQESFTKPN